MLFDIVSRIFSPPPEHGGVSARAFVRQLGREWKAPALNTINPKIWTFRDISGRFGTFRDVSGRFGTFPVGFSIIPDDPGQKLTKADE
jgi:hypothetical protein